MYDNDSTAAYRIYVTDSLRSIIGADKRYYDILPADNRKTTKSDYKSADEVVTDIMQRYNLTFAGEGG